MAQITKKAGDIFKVPLSKGRFSYAQWLPDGTARYFLVAHNIEVTIDEILALPIAFRVFTYKDTPNRYGWSKLGKASIPPECSKPQHYAKKDQINGNLSIYIEGIEYAASIEELKGLEVAAVWAHPHIVDRLEAQLNGHESEFLKTIKVA